MKKIIAVLCAATLAMAALFAQTPEEILEKMVTELNRGETEGLYMIMEMKIPILGSIPTKCYTKGEKMRLEVNIMDVKTVEISDGKTDWSYKSDSNELTITNSGVSGSSDADDGAAMMGAVTEGYDCTLSKETDTAWYISCKKQKSNTNKDDPKKIDIVVSKKTYLPLTFSAKISGITMVIKDVAIGVSESKVAYNPAEFAGATVIDKR
ncbi:MAG: hypothetical protein IKR69_05610 [Bacteroidales bacterium]|nr:hypothetical protein [Bacteroidales bacterium]